MALGYQTARGSISSNADTAIIAAPGLGAQIYILWITFSVSVAGTSSRLRLEKGTGGAVLARMATATADALLNLNYSTGYPIFPGNGIGDNVALNVNTSGAGAAAIDYEVAYRVRGRE
jgi:hypothetical protein